MEGRNGKRWFLIAAGTSVYDYLPEGDQRPEVTRSVAVVARCFTHLGYQQVLKHVSNSPASDAFLNALDDWLKADERSPDDVVALYYCGHGVSREDGHHLLTRNTQPNRLQLTAIQTARLGQIILEPGSRTGQVLLILDTCYAGLGAFDLGACLAQLYKATAAPEASRYIYIIGSTAPKQEARAEVFAQCLDQVALNTNLQCGGPTIQFLQPETVAGTVATILRTQIGNQSLRRIAIGEVPEQWLLFPNPVFDKSARNGDDLDTAKLRRDFPEHWIPRARGGELASHAWYFTGREQALREIVAWLRQQETGGICVVTGGAGTGKSAILSWLVTRADRETRKKMDNGGLADVSADLMPPEGIIDASIFAHAKTAEDVIRDIADCLNVKAVTAQDLRDAAERLEKKPLVVVVDALNEAKAPEAIVDALQNLAQVPRVKILVSTRPDAPAVCRFGGKILGGKILGGKIWMIDLDDLDAVDDIATYVYRRLVAVTPWGASGFVETFGCG